MSMRVDTVSGGPGPATALPTLEELKAADKDAVKLISKAKSELVLYRIAEPKACAFFMTVLFNLPCRFAPRIPTMATDGKTILYNPLWILSALPSHRELAGVLIHEAMHVILMHQLRRRGRDPYLWNVAGDLAINCVLTEARIPLPYPRLEPGQFDFEPFLSADEYYDLLVTNAHRVEVVCGYPGGQPGEPGDGPCIPIFKGGFGQVLDSGDLSGDHQHPDMDEDEVRVLIAQADLASRNLPGTLPGPLRDMVDQIMNPRVPYQVLLADFVERTAKDEYDWGRPSKKYLEMGLYLPSLSSDALMPVGISLDSSGSINNEQLAAFMGQVQQVLALSPVKLTIWYHHTKVYDTQELEPGDEFKLLKTKSGGTSHEDVFAHVAASDVACVICLTDLYTTFPDVAPQVPVLWITVGNDAPEAPFGQIVNVPGNAL